MGKSSLFVAVNNFLRMNFAGNSLVRTQEQLAVAVQDLMGDSDTDSEEIELEPKRKKNERVPEIATEDKDEEAKVLKKTR